MKTETAVARRTRMIRSIQAAGLRVFIGQGGRVTVWDKGDPSLEWGYRNLPEAFEDIQNLLGKPA